MAQEKRKLTAAEEQDEFEAYCLDLVLQPNTAYTRMLYWMLTAFPGDGYPIEMRPRSDWQGSHNQVAKLRAKIPGVMKVWRPRKKDGTLLHMWFEDNEAYQVFHRTVCKELGLTESKERAVAALVCKGQGATGDFYVFDEEWGYKNLGVPEFHLFDSGNWLELHEANKTRWEEAKNQLIEKWKANKQVKLEK
jgi:hypothetical protein